MKRLALIWTEAASQQILAIRAFVALDSPAYADALVDRLLERASQAACFSLSGREVPERPRSGLRELVGDGYRLVYVIKNKVVLVIAVLHSRQDAISGLPGKAQKRKNKEL